MQLVSIKAARVNAELTQAEMAKELGMSLSLYQDIENGVRAIKPLELYALCHVTGFAEHELRLPNKSVKCEQTEDA